MDERKFAHIILMLLIFGTGWFAIANLSIVGGIICLVMIGIRVYMQFMPYMERKRIESGDYERIKFNNELLEKNLGKLIALILTVIIGLAAVKQQSGVFLILFLGMVGFTVYVFLRKDKKEIDMKEQPAAKSTHHGSAGWAELSFLKQIGNNEQSGLNIGSGYLRKKGGHQITVAGSGQGKGTCLIIPALLTNPAGSFVITDPKGENAFITAKFQKSAGQRVFILDPWDEQTKLGAQHGIKKSGFNPFVFIKKDMNELNDTCQQVAQFLVPDKPNSNDSYWDDRARSMIRLFLMHIVTALPEREQNFWTLYKFLRLGGDQWLNLLLDLKDNKAVDGLISIGADELIGLMKTDNTLASIKSNAQNATTIFESSQLRQSLETNEFDPYFLTEGNCTVYIVIPERFIDTHSVWMRLVIGLCLKACNSKPNKRVNFILDEFAVLGKMKDVQRGYAYARGQNIVLWTFIQSLSQLKENYGEDGMNTFISNAAIFQAFGVKDYFTTEYISKMIGEATFEKQVNSYTTNNNATTSRSNTTSSSSSYQSYARRLMTPDEVGSFNGIIMLADNLRFKLQKQPYFKGPYAQRAAAPPREHF